MTEMTVRAGVGPLLRDWRQRRRRSQLDLALDAGVSARHLSFVETGRSNPSPEVVLALAEELEVPLRDRNHLLLAAGYAPRYGERSLDDPEMTPVRQALDLVLRGHEPYPAAVVDRWWEMVAANSGIALLTEGVAPELLEPPVNVMRVALHPDGMARQIVNFGMGDFQWGSHRKMGDKVDVWQGTLALMVLKTLESAGAAAWIRDRSPDRADQRRPPLVELRDAVPGAAEAGAGGLDRLRVGGLGEQPQGEVLPAHPGWPAPARPGGSRLGAGDGHSRALPLVVGERA